MVYDNQELSFKMLKLIGLRLMKLERKVELTLINYIQRDLRVPAEASRALPTEAPRVGRQAGEILSVFS